MLYRLSLQKAGIEKRYYSAPISGIKMFVIFLSWGPACFTRNPGLEQHWILWIFRRSVLGQDPSEPQTSTGETQEKHEKCELSPWYDWSKAPINQPTIDFFRASRLNARAPKHDSVHFTDSADPRSDCTERAKLKASHVETIWLKHRVWVWNLILYQTIEFKTGPNWKHLQTTNVKVNEMTESFLDRLENVVRKGENAGCQHFLLFSQCFQKLSF